MTLSPTPTEGKGAELIRHYAEVRARLSGAPVPNRMPRNLERLAILVRSDKVALPYVREKRLRDVIHVASDPVVVPTSARKVIVRQVCEKHGVSWLDITSDRRSAPIVAARNEAFYRLRHETSMSFPQIGKLMGGKDHATVIHGVRRYEAGLVGKVYKPAWRGRSNKAFAETLEATGP